MADDDFRTNKGWPPLVRPLPPPPPAPPPMVTEPKIAYVILHVIAVCGCKATILELSMGAVTECTKCKQKWRIKTVSYTPTTLDAEVEPISDLIVPGG